MPANPKENRTLVDHILLEQFFRKGYTCEEILEKDATIFMIKHEKKNSDGTAQPVSEVYKELLKAN